MSWATSEVSRIDTQTTRDFEYCFCYSARMKIAAFLAFALAVVLGIWAGTDYVRNEHDRQYGLDALNREITRELAGRNPDNSASEKLKEIASAERIDAIAGVVGFCALIAGVSMLASSKKVPTGQTA